MRSEATSPSTPVQKSSIAKIIQLLKTLKRLELSGKLTWTDTKQQQWNLFLNRGQIMYGAGGDHPIRRWRRNVLSWCPGLEKEASPTGDDLVDADNLTLSNCWEYQLLNAWLIQQKMTLENAAQITRDIIVEVLFDVIQAGELTYQFQRSQPLGAELVSIQVHEEEAFALMRGLWQSWCKAALEDISPNLAPVLKQPEQIRTTTSPQTYQTLTALIDGQQTLRDIAVKTHRDVVQITQALQYYIQLGWVELIRIPDYPKPTIPSHPQQSSPNHANSPLIACIDDSRMVCQSMEQVIQKAGYRFVSVMDAPRAIATLLTKKPDVIFLDLVMPGTNGYEICSQLRKVSLFKETPIIILTGNDGIVDQVRARLLGATDFLSKPMEPEVILDVIRKHLGKAALN